MAYGLKYYFPFKSDAGTAYVIRLYKDGYTGEASKRKLGGRPVLKQEKSGNICGSSLEFLAECDTDSEFAELYTTNPSAFLVEVTADMTGFSESIWKGFITPELYSEPYVDPPYDVKVSATDCLGELKLHDFPGGDMSFEHAVVICLSSSGMAMPLVNVGAMLLGSNYTFLAEAYTNFDHLAGKTCYDALERILATMHATLRQWHGYWLVMRETDVASQLGGTHGPHDEVPADSQVKVTDLAYNELQIESPVSKILPADRSLLFPVGKLTQTVVPAKARQRVTAPIAYKGILMPSAYGATSTSYTFGTPAQGPLTIKIPCKAIAQSTIPELRGMRVTVLTADGATYYLTAPTGGVLSTTSTSFTLTGDSSGSRADVLIEIPSLVSGTVKTVTLQWNTTWGHTWYLSDIYICSGDDFPSWVGTISLSNNARGEDENVEIAVSGSDVASDIRNFHKNTPFWGHDYIAAPSSPAISAMNILRFLERDYALSIAVPRLRVTGDINIPHSQDFPGIPLALELGGVNFLLEEWSLDMMGDTMTIDMISLPAAALTIASEIITITGNGEASDLPGTLVSPGAYCVAAGNNQDLPIVVTEYQDPEIFDWGISSSASWITIITTSRRGTGKTALFRCAVNNTGEERSSIITVSMRWMDEGGAQYSSFYLPVRQLG